MKENEFLDGVSNIETDVVERFVSMDNKLQKKANKPKSKGIWLRFGAIAACFVLILSAVIVVPMLREDDPVVTPGPGTTDIPPNNGVPSISTMISGDKITGKQELIYGNLPVGNDGNAEVYAPGFYLETVVEVEVIEILPDTYYNPKYYSRPLHVARLRVVDSIIGEGLPEEIYLYYPYYDTTVLVGYERFIMSLEQVGIENYMLVNRSQSRVDYFPNMFGVSTTRDLGYGSVVAFNEGIVDESFWDRVTYFHGSGTIKQMLDWELYPIWRENTLEQAKENILEYAAEDDVLIGSTICDYVTVGDVFISTEGKEIQEYVAPSSTNVFMQEISIRDDRIIARYTRIINGFLTDEEIAINGYTGENGNVLRRGNQYTADDLEKIPDIGEALANMKLSELKPTHIEIADGMNFSHSNATGVYRKANGKVYGIIRVMWYYKYPDFRSAYQMDDMYYLYDSDGNGSIVERDELKAVIGDDNFIQSFSYDEGIIAWD